MSFCDSGDKGLKLGSEGASLWDSETIEGTAEEEDKEAEKHDEAKNDGSKSIADCVFNEDGHGDTE